MYMGQQNVNDKRTILHIDDDPAILRLVAGRLSGHGYDVVSCNEPGEIEELLLATNARIVLLDIWIQHTYRREL